MLVERIASYLLRSYLCTRATGGGQWVLHGRYNFAAGTNGYVKVSGTSGNTGIQAAADAKMFLQVPCANSWLGQVISSTRNALTNNHKNGIVQEVICAHEIPVCQWRYHSFA